MTSTQPSYLRLLSKSRLYARTALTARPLLRFVQGFAPPSFATACLLPEDESSFGLPLPSGRSCSILVVSHHVDGLLHAVVRGFIAPRCRPGGSLRFPVPRNPSPPKWRQASRPVPRNAGSYPSKNDSSAAVPRHRGRCPLDVLHAVRRLTSVHPQRPPAPRPDRPPAPKSVWANLWCADSDCTASSRRPSHLPKEERHRAVGGVTARWTLPLGGDSPESESPFDGSNPACIQQLRKGPKTRAHSPSAALRRASRTTGSPEGAPVPRDPLPPKGDRTSLSRYAL
jgi:hypothetical protein